MKNRNNDNFEPLFYESEIRTNRYATIALAVVSGVTFIFGFLGYIDVFSALYPVAYYSYFICAIVMLTICVVLKRIKYDRPWVKNLIVAAIIFFGAVMNCLYYQNTIFIFYGPILISIMYYDSRFIRNVTVVSWAVFMLTVVSKSLADRYSPVMHEFFNHENEIIWHYPVDVLVYVIVPKTVNFFVAGFIGITAAKKGKMLILKQIEISNAAAQTKAQLDSAADIQMRAMPDSTFSTPDNSFNISAFLKPARETGGDFYDYFMVSENLLVTLVADVSDKGLASAMYVMKMKSILKYAIITELKRVKSDIKCVNLEKVINEVNDLIASNNKDNIFITLWIGCFDCNTGDGRYINAGHLPPIIVDKNGDIRYVENEPQLFVGVFENIPLKSETLKLNKGDNLILYTDGVTDARNADDVPFEKDRLVNSLKSIPQAAKSEAVTAGIINSLESHINTAEQFDDITIMTVNYFGGCDCQNLH